MEGKINLYLLRGLTRESGHWGDFIDIIQNHNPHFNIHLLDLPGAGIHYKLKANTTAKGMVAFLREQTLPVLQDKNQTHIICASSLAGMVATEWVLNHPKDFQGLITISASFKGICKNKERANPKMRSTMLKILMYKKNIEKREHLIMKVNSNTPELKTDLVKEWIAIQKERTMTRANILRQTLAGIRYSTRKRKPNLPLLIVGSKKDKLVAPECIIKTHQAFGGKLVWHPTAGHCLPLDEPDWLSVEISDWISSTKFIANSH